MTTAPAITATTGSDTPRQPTPTRPAPLILDGGPGTGRSAALVASALALLPATASSATVAEEVLVVTATEAAAADLRERLAAAGAVADRHPDLVATVADLAAQLLADHDAGTGWPGRTDRLDAAADRADFEARWAPFFDRLLDDPDAERALVLGFSLGLRPADLAAVAWELRARWERLDTDGPNRPAGADGSGHGPRGHDPDPLRADTGPVLAALDEAVAAVAVCTDDDDRLARHLRLLGEARSRLAAVTDDDVAGLELLVGLPSFRSARGRRQNWAGRIGEVRAACARAERVRGGLLDRVRRAVVADVLRRLAAFTVAEARERRRLGRLTDHDVLVHARRVLENGSAASGPPWRPHHLLVDDLEAAEPAARELVRCLIAAGAAGTDPGGRPGLVLSTDTGLAPPGAARRRLTANRRSAPGIVAFANVVADRILAPSPDDPVSAPPRLEPARVTEEEAAAGPAAVQLSLAGMAPVAPPGPLRTVGNDASEPTPVVTVGGAVAGPGSERARRTLEDAAAAARLAVEEGWPVTASDGTRRPARWSDVAVVVPGPAVLGAAEDACEAGAVPYALADTSLLWATDEVRDVLAVLRAVLDPADAVAVLGALRTPGLACGDDDLVTWQAAGGTWDPGGAVPAGTEDHPVAQAMAVLDRLGRRRWWLAPAGLVAETIDELHGFELSLARPRCRDGCARWRWLCGQARLFDETRGEDLRCFLAWAGHHLPGGAASTAAPVPVTGGAVRLLTPGAATGAGFPVVVVAGVDPDPGAVTPPAVLWTAAGHPEIGIGAFRSAGFERADRRRRRARALEQRHLLHRTLLRAEDHLVVCLHHDPRRAAAGTLGAGAPSAADPTGGSLAAALSEACAEHLSLWRPLRRPPSPGAGAPVAPVEAARAAPADGGDADPVDAGTGTDLSFDAGRARRLAAARRQDTTPPAPPTPVEAALHTTLAAVDLATGADVRGRPVDEVARIEVLRRRLPPSAAGAVAAAARRVLRSPVVAGAAGRRHWRAVAVTGRRRPGVVEGTVDLVVEEDDGLVVVGYRAERHPTDDAAEAARLAELGELAAVLASATGRPVVDAVLVSAGDGDGAGDAVETNTAVASPQPSAAPGSSSASGSDPSSSSQPRARSRGRRGPLHSGA